jgi:hypothetical protein
MHFHLPKPIHGWRQFFGEVGIIVLGVLIALSAEQIVHNITEKRKTGEAQERIKNELGLSLGLSVERIAVSPCVQNRLRGIATELASGRQDWRTFVYPATGDFNLALKEVYHSPSRAWIDDAYRGALSQGDLNSARPEERAKLAAIYKLTGQMTQLNQREHELATRLAVLQFNPALTSTERHQMIETVSELDYVNALMVLMAQQTINQYHGLRGIYTWDAQRIALSRSRWASFRPTLLKNYGACIDPSAIERLVHQTNGPFRS